MVPTNSASPTGKHVRTSVPIHTGKVDISTRVITCKNAL